MAEEKTTWYLDPNQELRIELHDKDQISIRLDYGTAEIFGTEILPTFKDTCYEFKGPYNFSVFSHKGCCLLLTGKPHYAYLSEDQKTSFPQFTCIHTMLELLRTKEAFPPCLAVVGGKDSGKSTLCRFLSNYAVRSGKSPTLVDLSYDNLLTLPGAIAQRRMSSCFEAQFPALIEKDTTMFCTGGSTLATQTPIFLETCQFLANTIKHTKDGVIINTPPLQSGQLPHFLAIFKMFRVNIVVVLGDDHTASALKETVENPVFSVLTLAKPYGVVAQVEHKAKRRRVINDYLNGVDDELKPTVYLQKISKLPAFYSRIAPKSAMPLGQEPKILHFPLQQESLSGEEDGILAVYSPKKEKLPDTFAMPITGFAYVSKESDFVVQLLLPDTMPPDSLLRVMTNK